MGVSYERSIPVIGQPLGCTSAPPASTRGPSWGHLLVVLGAILSFLEPFCGHLLPKVDKFSCKQTFEILIRRALRGSTPAPTAIGVPRS